MIAIAGLALAAAGGGCGGEEDPSASGPAPVARADRGGVVEIEVDPGGSPAYVQQSIEVPAGAVQFLLVNRARTPHDLVIAAPDGSEVTRTARIRRGTAAATATLEPGTYTFLCSVEGHREAGMEGPLTAG